MAKLLARSSIVPEAFRGDQHIGDCVLALEICNRIGASILAVMQNLCFVDGKPGWSSQFLIACVNSSGRFSPIRYQMTGKRGDDSWGCIAWAIDKTGQALESPEVTIRVAKQEGWYYRIGSKWQTMPELMLYYRSATIFARLYAPEITMGIPTADEVVDVGFAANGKASRPIFEAAAAKPKPGIHTQVESKNKSSITDRHQAMPVGHQLKALTGLISLSKHCEADVLKFLCKTRKCDESLLTLAEVADRQPDAIAWTHDHWKSVDREITRLKEAKSI